MRYLTRSDRWKAHVRLMRCTAGGLVSMREYGMRYDAGLAVPAFMS